MRLMLVFWHLIMSSNKIRARRFQCECDVCALLQLFYSSASHTHTESLTLDKHARTHTWISPHTHTHTSVPSGKQSDRVTEQRQARCVSPLPNSALSNECVQCEVAATRTISLCNYVTRSKNQDVFSSASPSLVQFDILSVLQLSVWRNTRALF